MKLFYFSTLAVIFVFCSVDFCCALNKWSCSCDGGEASAMLLGDDEVPGSTYVKGDPGPPGKRGPMGPVGAMGPPGMEGQRGLKGPPGNLPTASELWDLGSWLNPGFSCKDLNERGVNETGIYMIKLNSVPTPIPVYCDMESVNGGWTLVARIHENNIKGKCTTGDKWSSESGAQNAGVFESNNWSNLNYFGSPFTPTSSDYKSPAYFALNASNLMVWQVPNNVDYVDMPEQASLKMHTDNNFLLNYDGNLRSLFKNNFPLKKYNLGEKFNTVEGMLQTLKSYYSTIRSTISSFYSYAYDQTNYISDGGSDMFDNGNYIYYQVGDNGFVGLDSYNKTYRSDDGAVVIGTVTSHPFHALMWIENENRTTDTFSLRVISNLGADGSGKSTIHSGSTTHGTLTAHYHAHHAYDASDPSVCQVIYYVADSKDCALVRPSAFIRENWSTGTNVLHTTMKVSGSPRHVLMGYTLLSKVSAAYITNTEVKSTINAILQKLALNKKDILCDSTSLEVPIKYTKGSNSLISSHVPPNVRSLIQPGYLEFAAVGDEGYTYALCPGVKTKSTTASSRVCVGSMNTMQLDQNSCGDFAGWGGTSSNNPSNTSPSGHAKSLNDQNSSILLFVK